MATRVGRRRSAYKGLAAALGAVGSYYKGKKETLNREKMAKAFEEYALREQEKTQRNQPGENLEEAIGGGGQVQVPAQTPVQDSEGAFRAGVGQPVARDPFFDLVAQGIRSGQFKGGDVLDFMGARTRASDKAMSAMQEAIAKQNMNTQSAMQMALFEDKLARQRKEEEASTKYERAASVMANTERGRKKLRQAAKAKGLNFDALDPADQELLARDVLNLGEGIQPVGPKSINLLPGIALPSVFGLGEYTDIQPMQNEYIPGAREEARRRARQGL